MLRPPFLLFRLFPLPVLCNPLLHQFQLPADGWFLAFIQRLPGIFLKCRRHDIHILCLEKYKITGRGDGCVFFQAKINAVFPGTFLKGFDIAVCHFNIGKLASLIHQLLHALFPVAFSSSFLRFLHCLFLHFFLLPVPLLLFHLCQRFQHGGFQNPCGDLAAIDAQRYGFLIYLVLQVVPPPFLRIVFSPPSPVKFFSDSNRCMGNACRMDILDSRHRHFR